MKPGTNYFFKYRILPIILICIFVCFTGCKSVKVTTTPDLSIINTTPILIKNVTVVDVENERFIPKQVILIKNGIITYLGNQNLNPPNGSHIIDGTDLIAMPGFIDTHTHLWQHLTRSLESNAILQDWVKTIYPYAHYINNDELERLTYIAARQAQLSGITTVSDFASVNFRYGSVDTTFKGLQKANMGGFVTWWHPAVFLPPELRETHFKETLYRIKSYDLDLSMGFGPLSFMPLPAVYDGIRLGIENSVLLSEHTMENLDEARDFQSAIARYVKDYGYSLRQTDLKVLQDIVNIKQLDSSNLVVRAKRDLAIAAGKPSSEGVKVPSMYPLLHHLGALKKFLAIHSVWLNEEDIKLMNLNNASVSHNPESNMYLASGAAPLLDYKKEGVVISLGTDGAASNDRIDMFTAMRSTANLLKVSRLNAKQTAAINSWAILKAATINGARAMGLEAKTGSVAVGKEADLLLLSKNRLSAAPFSKFNDAALLINSVSAGDVHTVISNGQLIVENFSLKTDNEADLSSELNKLFETVHKKKENGYTISYSYTNLNNSILDYFSVRKKDSLNLSVYNTTPKAKFVRIMLSAGAFGGATSVTLSEKTLERFPLKKDAMAYDRSFLLIEGEHLKISKSKNNYNYIIQTPNGQFQYSGKAGQLSITVH